MGFPTILPARGGPVFVFAAWRRKSGHIAEAKISILPGGGVKTGSHSVFFFLIYGDPSSFTAFKRCWPPHGGFEVRGTARHLAGRKVRSSLQQ